MSIKIFRNFILKVECKLMLYFFNGCYYFEGNPGLFEVLVKNVLLKKKSFRFYRTTLLVPMHCQQHELGLGTVDFQCVNMR